MNVEFGIEVPGEANPLTEGILYHVLRSASSSDMQQVQTGTKQLQEWEKARGYYPLLQTVFLDKSLPLEVRYLAIIQLKNGIDKYWRKTATNAVSKEDKAAIRARLLESAVDEADQRLALQNALVVAKIVRFEFPNDWPELFQQLLQILRASTDPSAYRLQLPRALLVLLYIVKELSTGRLLRTRQSLQTVAPEIFNVLATIYVNKVQTWQSFFRDGGEDEGGAMESVEHSLLAIKIVRRLLIAGYEFPGREKDVQEFWTLTRTHLGEFFQYVSAENSPLGESVQKLIEKHLMQLSKLHLNMALTHPASFVLLPNSIPLVRDYWGLVARLGEVWGSKSLDGAKIGTDGDAEDDDAPINERLGLKGLLLIRACVKMVFYPTQTFKYKQQQEKDERTQAVQAVKQELLTDDLVREMISTLVTRFFVFRPSDLRMWEEEPDEWEKMEEGAEDWEFAIRPCAEKLFLDLAKNFKDLIVQPLLQVFYSVATPDNEDILFKDSVYTAIGLAADILHDQLDFDAFLENTLVPEAGKQKPGFNIIRRRIAIIISQWIAIKIAQEKKPIVYQIFQHLLDTSDPLNDQVVRVTAGRRFKDIADEWEFHADNFLPYAPTTLERLMALVQEVDLPDTKMALLNTISIIVERLEHHITPYANSIVSLLPPLWSQSGEEHLMKQAILTLLARLTNAMKADSRTFHVSFLPIIQSAIEPDSETQVYLLEDALDLWASIVAQTPSAPEPTPQELLNLLPYLLPLYSMDNETLRKAIEITEAYLLLAPAAVLADDFRKPLLVALADLLGTLRPEANGILTHLVQCVIRGADGVGGENAVRVLTQDLLSTGFFAKVLEGLHGAWTHHQAHGPLRELPSRAVDGVVETDYFTVLARIGLASPTVLLEALASVASDGLEKQLNWLLEEWFGHVENIGDGPGKKLMTLVLTRLLETGQSWALERLQNFMALWTDVLGELLDGMDDRSVDCLYWPPEPYNPTEPEAPEDVRKRDLLYSDPVHQINLVAFVREHVQQAVQASGGEQRFQEEWLSRVDKDVLKGFGELGIIKNTPHIKHAFNYLSYHWSNHDIGNGLIAALLQRPNTTVIAGVRNPAAPATTLDSLPTAAGSKVIIVKIDPQSETDAKETVSQLGDQHGITSIEVVVANADIAHSGTTVAQTTSESLREHLNTNTIGPVFLFQAFKPLLQASKRGNPIFLATLTVVGSIGRQDALAGLPPVLNPYGASKAALNWLVRRLHYEEPWLTAYVTHPGLVLTDMASGMFGTPEQATAMGAIMVHVSVAGILKTLDQADRVIGGTLQNYDGTTLSWQVLERHEGIVQTLRDVLAVYRHGTKAIDI